MNFCSGTKKKEEHGGPVTRPGEEDSMIVCATEKTGGTIREQNAFTSKSFTYVVYMKHMFTV